MEFNPSAARCAAQNARANGAGNARFLCADATACLQGMAARGERADVVFLDPPRAGSTPEFLGAVDRMGPERIVYISCNPETQRRDLRLLAGWGWRARLLQPVDLFPHTEHVECVAVLAKIRGGGEVMPPPKSKQHGSLARNVRRQAPILLCVLRFLRRHGGSHAFDHHVSVLVGAYGVQLDDILFRKQFLDGTGRRDGVPGIDRFANFSPGPDRWCRAPAASCPALRR